MTPFVCPVCKRDTKNLKNLAAHLKAAHPDYTNEKQEKAKKRNEQQRASAARISAQNTYAGNDIGAMPPVVDPARREAAGKSLKLFCKTYFPAKFSLPFSKAHDAAIARAEEIITEGGVYAYGMPRGSGKTEIAIAATLWALLYGYRHYVVLIAATHKLSKLLLADVKQRLADTPLLLEDFPEVCYPLMKLDNTPQKARKQHIGGVPTHVEWTDEHCRLPIVAGSVSSWGVITVASMESAIRGPRFPAPDGSTWRPDLALVDDPQTRESARSPQQTENRLSIIQADVRGLGDGAGIGILVTCTVIYEGDLAEQLLDRDQLPEFRGDKAAMVEKFPDVISPKWDQYFEIKTDELKAGGKGRVATEFYVANRVEMDAGFVLTWPERFERSYASAIEQAMHLRKYNPDGFASEYQNQPLLAAGVDAGGRLTAEALRERTSNLDHWVPLPSATRITAGIDVQKRCVFWSVTAWDEGFGGSIIDWGVYPKQKTNLFRAADPRPSLEDSYPLMDDKARIHAGLTWVMGYLMSQDQRPERVLVDSGNWTSEINQFVLTSPHRSVLLSSKGYGGSLTKPLGSYKVEGQRKGPPGHNGGRVWVINPMTEGKRQRTIIFDSHHWKSFLRDRLKVAVGGVGCLWLPAGDNEGLISHFTSEQGVSKTNNKTEKTVEEWAMKPGRSENHWWDTTVLCAVGASELGLRFDAAAASVPAGSPVPTRPAPPKRKYIDPREAVRQARSGTNLPGQFRPGGW